MQVRVFISRPGAAPSHAKEIQKLYTMDKDDVLEPFFVFLPIGCTPIKVKTKDCNTH